MWYGTFPPPNKRMQRSALRAAAATRRWAPTEGQDH
jgi:hypothetical protein